MSGGAEWWLPEPVQRLKNTIVQAVPCSQDTSQRTRTCLTRLGRSTHAQDPHGQWVHETCKWRLEFPRDPGFTSRVCGM